MPHEENLTQLSLTVSEYVTQNTGGLLAPTPAIGHRDWVNVLTSNTVVEAIATQLTNCSRRT